MPHVRLASRLAAPSRPTRLRHAAPALRATRIKRADEHKANALSLLSAGDAATAELAAVLELSTQYLGTLLGHLELEGRIEKVGRGVWRLP